MSERPPNRGPGGAQSGAAAPDGGLGADRVGGTKPTLLEEAFPTPPQSELTGETAVRPPDDRPHPAERPEGSGYVFARFDEEGAEDATSVDPRTGVAEMATSIIDALPANPYLECVAGPDHGKVFTLRPGTTTVGRALENDVILTDVSVSRRHFSLRWNEHGVAFEDLGSGNGTKLGGQRLAGGPVRDGDTLTCGETTLLLKVPTDGKAVAMPRSTKATTADVPVGRARDATTELPRTVPVGPAWRGHPGWSVVTGRLRAAMDVVRGWPRAYKAAALVALVGAVLGLAWWVAPGPPTSGGTGDEGEQAFQSGLAAFGKAEWEMAAVAFERAQRLSPDHREAPVYLERARRAAADAARLRSVHAALQSGQVELAERLLAGVAEETPLGAEVAELRVAIASAWESRQREKDGKTSPGPAPRPSAPSEGRRAEGPAKRPVRVEPERWVDTHARESTSGGTDTAGAPGGETRRRALGLYAKESFVEAAELLRQGAPKGRDGAELEDLANRIERFARVFEDARTGTGARRVESLRSALVLDKAISGGLFAKRLEGPLLDAYVANADQAFDQDNVYRACEAVRQAFQVRASDPRLASRVKRCEAEAKELLEEGDEAKGASVDKAKDLYRRAMLMVPPASSVYAAANKKLTALAAAAARDEDE